MRVIADRKIRSDASFGTDGIASCGYAVYCLYGNEAPKDLGGEQRETLTVLRTDRAPWEGSAGPGVRLADAGWTQQRVRFGNNDSWRSIGLSFSVMVRRPLTTDTREHQTNSQLVGDVSTRF